MKTPIVAFLFLFVLSAASAQLNDFSPGKWSVSVQYPRFRAGTPVAAEANRWASRREREVFGAFLAQAKQDLPELQKVMSHARYELLVRPTVSLQTGELCSGYVESYAFTGGAHGSTTFETVNFSGSGRRLQLQDLFPKGTDGRKQASFAILEQMLGSGKASAIQDGVWKELTAEQSERFVLTKSGILFLFNDYELGAYSEGRFKILVPFDKLAGLDRKGPYRALFGPSPMTLSGLWTLDRVVVGSQILRPEPGGAYDVEFRADGKVFGVAGRNRIRGDYSASGNKLRFGPLVSTKIGDPPNSIAPRYLGHLSGVTGYRFAKETLVLHAGQATLHFRRK